MVKIFQLSLALLLILLLLACNNQKPSKAAPLGEKQTLEILADSYRKVSARYPTAPMGLHPKAKREFVERVFVNAGYHYSNTLFALSRINPNEITQYHRDIKQLLFLPKTGLSEEDSKDVYNESERNAIREIEKKL